MKKLFLGLSLFAFIGFTTAACNTDDDNNTTIVEANTLPNEGQLFITTHFPGTTISVVEKYNPAKADGTMYEVKLSNGVEIDLDQAGNWIEVDAPSYASLPTSFILPNIVNYIETNYPAQGINSIDKTVAGFDVELVNDIDLIFDTNGNFLRIKP
ncbi:PepSY-like domain-containing protein [Faecalibacter rhinopitheci]|uniref:PepSY-like domain-containing protein n=1 Tax=Faecalibacter rhinopitheci TaxID=2779678 RepID=A0A8J7FP87_9FLAO|nr:PepSY-like domain-containing protein [Faecalibacter rhinopitheci]MBF0596789.1 PepSY-like domain-containing protein [Faecalibacter rhinopitheci]